MALGPNSERASRNTAGLAYEERTRGRVAICNAENSALAVETFRRDSRPNVRPYKRTSKQKLKWTSELHQCFKRAVEKLGGQDKATPKRIMHEMKREGITIAHIKSHLQMFRSGKINSEGLSKIEYESLQGGELRINNVGLQDCGSITPGGSSAEGEQSGLRNENSLVELSAMALMQLREDSERSNSDSGAAAAPESQLRGSSDNQSNLQPYVHKKYKALEQLEDTSTKSRKFVVELNEKYVHNGPNRVQELYQQDLGQPSTYQPNRWPSPGVESSFLCEAGSTDHLVDVTNALGGSKRKAEEDIELNLTMATRALRPTLQFASDLSPEEAGLSLGLRS